MRKCAYRGADMKDLVKVMKALSDETRIRMINLLLQRECCVCEVMEVLEISQTRASRNLTMLYDVGFLKLRKEGLWSHYFVDKASLESYQALLLESITEGLKQNTQALQDIERLKTAKRLSPQCCNS